MALIDNKSGAAAVDPDDHNAVVDAVVALQAGGGAFTGAILTLSASVTGYTSGTVIPFNTAAYDSGGYFNVAGTKIVIPAGKAGWYRIGLAVFFAGIDSGTQSAFSCQITTSGDPDNAAGAVVTDTSGGAHALAAYVMGPLVVGDDLRGRIDWIGGGTVDVSSVGAQLTCQYLGAA